MNTSRRSLLVAIVGGSGSGKSWLADKLQGRLGRLAGRLSLDDFYLDRSYVTPRLRAFVNFDHPRAIDWPALKKVLVALASGRSAVSPCYDFKTHCRSRKNRDLPRKRIWLVDGLWLLRPASIRALFDLSIYLDCPPSVRLKRRITRDQAARGRSADSVRRQFREMVEPMHQRFVSPQTRWANVCLKESCGQVEVSEIDRLLRKLLAENSRA